jgi:hypothetical protein
MRYDLQMASPLAVRRASAADTDVVTSIITLAFAYDPLWAHALARPDGGTAHHADFWRLFVAGALRYPDTWLTSGGEATSVWIPPGGTELTPEQEEHLADLAADHLGRRPCTPVGRTSRPRDSRARRPRAPEGEATARSDKRNSLAERTVVPPRWSARQSPGPLSLKPPRSVQSIGRGEETMRGRPQRGRDPSRHRARPGRPAPGGPQAAHSAADCMEASTMDGSNSNPGGNEIPAASAA